MVVVRSLTGLIVPRLGSAVDGVVLQIHVLVRVRRRPQYDVRSESHGGRCITVTVVQPQKASFLSRYQFFNVKLRRVSRILNLPTTMANSHCWCEITDAARHCYVIITPWHSSRYARQHAKMYRIQQCLQKYNDF